MAPKGARDDFQPGRAAFAAQRWSRAHRLLTRADRGARLAADDLEKLAVAAYMLGLDKDFLDALERAHRLRLAGGDEARAARDAFWIGLSLFLSGDAGRATGWLNRARRLSERRDCAECGYLLLPVAEQQLGAGDPAGAYATASDALAVGERFREADLVACARHLQGRALVEQGRLQAGLALMDEAMVAASGGELSPIMTGLVYCSVIDACQAVYASDRAGEWTEALSRWCESQPEMTFTGICLVHRAEVLELHGDWEGALREARRAGRPRAGRPAGPPAAAFYRQGEVHRLRGEFDAAEEAYRQAHAAGCEPVPGLPLLRLAQGRIRAAASGIARALAGAAGRSARARLLPAYIEVMLTAGLAEEARAGAREIGEIAGYFGTAMLDAMAAQALGAVRLAEGDARAALAPLRRAKELWLQVQVPYAAARVRVLLALACRDLGDAEGCELEREAAQAVFRRLGAAPDLAKARALSASPDAAVPLTARELQVLRMVASGKTNRAIAAKLVRSEKTVDRHLSNILSKLNVPSRAAATAYAYEHKLI